MRLITWLTILILSFTLAYISIVEGFSFLDFLATAVLIFISMYVVLRYSLSILLGVKQGPLININFRYLQSLVFYCLTLILIGYTIDIILTIFIHRTTLAYIVSIAISTAIVYSMNKFLKFKGFRIILIISIFILGILYMLGYIPEFIIPTYIIGVI